MKKYSLTNDMLAEMELGLLLRRDELRQTINQSHVSLGDLERLETTTKTLIWIEQEKERRRVKLEKVKAYQQKQK